MKKNVFWGYIYNEGIRDIFLLKYVKSINYKIMTKLEIIRMFENGEINTHKRDMMLLKLSKENINKTRESRGLFKNGFKDLNKAI